LDTSTAASTVPVLLREDRAGVAYLTLNRPDRRNALSVGLMTALEAELKGICVDQAVRAVVIRGAGQAFCAGHDLKEIRANPGRQYSQSVFAQCSRLMLSITRLPQPVIAQVQGIATAAGVQLVATCDLAVAAASARFCTPGVSIGLFCATPAVALSRNVGRKHAMEMLLTGDFYDAEDARRFGLINRVVPDELLAAETEELAVAIASRSRLTLALGKRSFYEQLDCGLEGAYANASETMTCNMLAADAEEGIDAFLEKRAPKWKHR
jgi:enoyl-CoA hydratase/carnithine racemase